MNRMANVLKRASRQAKKQLYQSVGETEGALKGKPGLKKQVSKASVVPGIPEGETIDTLEEQKQQLQEICHKGSPDLSTLHMLMDTTFPLRRRDVLLNNVRVWKLLKEYPPLENGNGSEVSVSLVMF